MFVRGSFHRLPMGEGGMIDGKGINRCFYVCHGCIYEVGGLSRPVWVNLWSANAICSENFPPNNNYIQ